MRNLWIRELEYILATLDYLHAAVHEEPIMPKKARADLITALKKLKDESKETLSIVLNIDVYNEEGETND